METGSNSTARFATSARVRRASSADAWSAPRVKPARGKAIHTRSWSAVSAGIRQVTVAFPLLRTPDPGQRQRAGASAPALAVLSPCAGQWTWTVIMALLLLLTTRSLVPEPPTITLPPGLAGS